MKGLLLCLSILITPAIANANVVDWTWFSSPALIDRATGLDGFYGTGDDVNGLGGQNPNGAASGLFVFDGLGGIQRAAFFTGTATVNYAIDFSTIADGGFGTTTAAWLSASITGLVTFPSLMILNAPYTGALETGFAPQNVNTVTVNDDNTFSNDFLLTTMPGGETTRQVNLVTGWYLFRGQDPASAFADPDVIAHFNEIIPLLPVDWTAVALEHNAITILNGASAGLMGGTSASFYTTAPIPVPAPMILLGSGLVALLFKRRAS